MSIYVLLAGMYLTAATGLIPQKYTVLVELNFIAAALYLHYLRNRAFCSIYIYYFIVQAVIIIVVVPQMQNSRW